MRRKYEESTIAADANRDADGQPLPKPPRPADASLKWGPGQAWGRMLARSRSHPVLVSMSSLARFHRLRLPAPAATTFREPVKQFRGSGFSIQALGLVCAIALWWFDDLRGAAVGLALAAACLVIGRARSKPWRCGNCKTPLATAKVRVCPGCRARLVDNDVVKVVPQAPR